LSLLIVFYIGV